MANNSFASILTAELNQVEETSESLLVLQEFCEGVEMSTAQRVSCTLERGYPSRLGQEWRPMLVSRVGGPRQLLFRAFIPAEGYPVSLDLHQGALTTAQSAWELRSQLEELLRDPAVVEQIRYVMNYSAVPAAPNPSIAAS